MEGGSVVKIMKSIIGAALLAAAVALPLSSADAWWGGPWGGGPWGGYPGYGYGGYPGNGYGNYPSYGYRGYPGGWGW